MNDVQRVWRNTSDVNWSFIDYRAMMTGSPCVVRWEIPPLCGVRLPKGTIEVMKVGHGMTEGRAE